MKNQVSTAHRGLEALEPRTLFAFDSALIDREIGSDAVGPFAYANENAAIASSTVSPTASASREPRAAAFEPRVKPIPGKAAVAEVPPLPPPSPSADIADSLSASLPPFLSRGQKLNKPAVLLLTNRTGVPISGTTTVTLLFSQDTIVDGSDAEVNVVPVQLNLALGSKKRIELKMPEVPQLADGSYYLLGQLQRAGAAPETIASTRVFVVGSPIVNLRLAPPTLSLGKGRKSLGPTGNASFEIQNIGDGEARGLAAVTLYAKSATTGLRVPLCPAKPCPVKLQAGWTSKVNMKFITPAGLEKGTYTLVAELSPRTVATGSQQSVSGTCLTTFQVA